MRRAILTVGVILLAAACGASGGGAGSPAQPGTQAQQVKAQPVVRAAQPVTVQAQPAAAPTQAPPAQPARPTPAPTSSGPSGGPGVPIGDDGPLRPCPVGTNPSLHKMCPV